MVDSGDINVIIITIISRLYCIGFCSFLQTELPWQWQNAVQAKLAITHPHFLEAHGESEAHEQHTSLRM